METRKRKIDSLKDEIEKLEERLKIARIEYSKAERGISLIEFIGCAEEDNKDIVSDILDSDCTFFRKRVKGGCFRTEYRCEKYDTFFMYMDRKEKIMMNIGSYNVCKKMDELTFSDIYDQFRNADLWEGGKIPHLWTEDLDPELCKDWDEDEWHDRMKMEWKSMLTCAGESVKDLSKYRMLRDMGLKKGPIISMILYKKCRLDL